MQFCANCPYNKFARMKVVSPKKASLVIIGEAVNTAELRTGKYFQSQAGDILKETLKKVQLPWDDNSDEVYFTAALKCKPPTGKVISKEAIHCCRNILVQELKIAQPKMIITLGVTASQMVLNDSSLKITKILGQSLSSVDFPEVPIIPCYNPAMVMRAPATYKIFHQIMRMAAGMYYQTNVLDPGVTEYEVLRTEEDVKKAVIVLSKVGGTLYTGWDIETTGLNPRSDRMLTVGVAYDKNKVFVFAPSAFPWLNFILDLPNVKQIWHNGKFDTSFLIPRGHHGFVHEDIMLLHYCLNENSGTHDLGQLSTFYLGASEYKSKANAYIHSKEGFASAEEEIIFERVAIDADYTLQLWHILHAQVMSNEGLAKLYNGLLIPASELLRKMERYGMLVDPPALEVLRVKYEKQIDDLITEIQDATEGIWDPDLYQAQTGAKTASAKFKPSSTKQMSWLVFDRLRLHPVKKKGRSTDADVLLSLAGNFADEDEAKQMVDQQFPLFGKILDLRGIRKEQSTYVVGTLKRMDEQQRVHSTFSLHITTTGRLSSKDPNVQNIPSDKLDVRKCYIPPKGFILMEPDYQGAELRTLAYVSGDEKLKAVFKEGRNLHKEVATRFFGKNFNHAQKMIAKTINFGIPYGREAYSIALKLNISVRAAQDLINQWFQMFPQALEYLQSCDAAVLNGEILTTPLGRMRRFGLVTPDNVKNAENEARNYRVQSITSDLVVLTAERIYDPLVQKYNTHIIDLIHDSMLEEVPIDAETIFEVGKLATKELIRTPQMYLPNCDVPYGVDIDLGPNWGSTEENDVGPWTDENGGAIRDWIAKQIAV